MRCIEKLKTVENSHRLAVVRCMLPWCMCGCNCARCRWAPPRITQHLRTVWNPVGMMTTRAAPCPAHSEHRAQ
jgi:hypothetical protein